VSSECLRKRGKGPCEREYAYWRKRSHRDRKVIEGGGRDMRQQVMIMKQG